jgi:hypothetical protein
MAAREFNGFGRIGHGRREAALGGEKNIDLLRQQCLQIRLAYRSGAIDEVGAGGFAQTVPQILPERRRSLSQPRDDFGRVLNFFFGDFYDRAPEAAEG